MDLMQFLLYLILLIDGTSIGMLQNETAFDFADLFLLCISMAFAKTV